MASSRRLLVAAALWLSACPASRAGVAELDRGMRRLPGHMIEGARESGRSRNLLWLAAAGGTAAILTTQDRDFQNERRKDPLLGGSRKTGSSLGSPAVLYGGTGAWFLAAHLSPFPLGRQNSEIALESLAAAGIAAAALKGAVGRRRPDGSNRLSFPSLHAAGSFTLATVAARGYGWKAGLPAYLGAGFVSLSRLEEDKHFASDTVFGAALGVLVASSFARVHEAQRRTAWNLRPYALPTGRGLEAGVLWEF